jgi:hypothetical protein
MRELSLAIPVRPITRGVMKTELDHLPEGKRRELELVIELIVKGLPLHSRIGWRSACAPESC